MDIILLVVLAVVAGLAAGLYVARGRSTGTAAPDVAVMRAEVRALAERVAAESGGLAQRLEGIDSRMTQTQVASSTMARDIFESLGDLRTATSAVAEQAREFNVLSDLLKAPKARGGLGEAMLAELLGQVLPPSAFALQHRFSSGATVDAVVRAGGRLVCIDSKFPLPNYRRMSEAGNDAERKDARRAFARDVANHIRAIATRYIVPDEDTLEFAVMYVPAEGVYSEMLQLKHHNEELFELAISSKVVPMSPLTLYGYLQTVLYGLRCLSVERGAEKILDACGRLHQDFERFATEYETLGGHLYRARAKYEEGGRKLDRFRDRLGAMVEESETDELKGTDPVDRPNLEAVND
ncbi:MAG: DNA recombination protein RmuC [Actinomycetota bacterium]